MKVCQLCVLDFTTVNLLKNLIKTIENKGHEVITICEVNEHKDEIEKENINVINFKISRSFNIVDHIIKTYSLYKIFKKEKFDIIHVHTPIGSIIGRLAAFLANNKNVIYTVHGFYFHDKMPILKKIFFFLIEFFLSFITKKFFFQSIEDYKFAQRKFNKSKLFYIGNGINLNIFDKKKLPKINRDIFWNNHLDHNSKNLKILIVARIVKQKGILDIINLSKRKNMSNFDFIFIGSQNKNEHDNELNYVLNMSKQLQNIFFLGYQEDVRNFYTHSDIFILPSYREGKPRSIIEAMVMELPVIATNIRGCRELIDPKVPTGMLYEPGDIDKLEKIINDIISDKDYIAKVIKNAKKFAIENLDENKIINKQLGHMNL